MMKRSSAPNALEEFNRLIVAWHNELIGMDYPEQIRFLLDEIADNPGRFGLHDIPQPFGLEDLPDDFKEVVARCVMLLGIDAEFNPLEGYQGDWEPILEEDKEMLKLLHSRLFYNLSRPGVESMMPVENMLKKVNSSFLV